MKYFLLDTARLVPTLSLRSLRPLAYVWSKTALNSGGHSLLKKWGHIFLYP